MNKIRAYIEEVVKEMRKVSWPKREELYKNTGITLVASFAVALIIFGADRVISTVLEFIYRI